MRIMARVALLLRKRRMQNVIVPILQQISVTIAAQRICRRFQQRGDQCAVRSMTIVTSSFLEWSMTAPAGKPILCFFVALGTQIEAIGLGEQWKIRTMGHVTVDTLTVFERRVNFRRFVLLLLARMTG